MSFQTAVMMRIILVDIAFGFRKVYLIVVPEIFHNEKKKNKPGCRYSGSED